VPNAEMPSRLARFHAVALLSDYEGLPIAILEAMACGVVPICLDVRSGVPELIEDGVTGFRVHDRDEGFVAAVSRLAGDRALWGRMRLACRERIEARYTLAREADTWAALLGELASRRRSTALRAPLVVPLPSLAPELAQQDRSLRARAWRRLRRTPESAT
jgi:glycosyltransferase involved in cell wall biosynthesis